jgi:cyclic beta-1,2-glucan synthetase
MLIKSSPSKISLARPRMRRQRARELPLRAELFGIEQLARHARLVAAQHTIVMGRTSARLLTRLDQNEKVLRAFNRATLEVDESRRVTPATE